MFEAHSTQMIFDRFCLQTNSFNYLMHLLDKDSGVVLKGPKGSGKSHSLIGVMAMYSYLNKPCILLTQQSVVNKQDTLTYLINLQKHYCELLKFTFCASRSRVLIVLSGAHKHHVLHCSYI